LQLQNVLKYHNQNSSKLFCQTTQGCWNSVPIVSSITSRNKSIGH